MQKLELRKLIREVKQEIGRIYEDSLSKPEPNKMVYHYTSLQGLMGILDTGKMWASHVRYMNDPEEITYGRKLCEEMLRTVKPEWNDHKKKGSSD